MKPLRVTPAYGHDGARLYVTLATGRTLAWYDRDTGRVSLLAEGRREEVLTALAPYVTGPLTVGPPPVPTSADLARLALHPDDDLAPNRPGETLYGTQAEASALRRFRPDPRRESLAALQLIGDELDGLEGIGWRILHCVPLPGGTHLDHLLIGPAGILTVHTVPSRNRRFRLDAPATAPHLRRAAHDAERAALALAAAVRPCLAVVGATRVDAAAPPVDDIHLLRDGSAATTLAHLGGILKPADIESLYTTARNRHTWLHP
ncbi:NERD domain-containing protein [Streptomyces sp. NBC_00237]|uniref:nuclease-related domain-containing protein n=1 Tax=Streptomyces sp. NBC_00237 TaxID=2975687 RepID=UPI0022574D9C|nr:nuclease-related domain-containing protein [Streptomyces sp. NBC_00237]MCX5204217.1 NERD domain-containing protein [Streptomyces sp. NBC_00237]